jgi:tRNA-binding protein
MTEPDTPRKPEVGADPFFSVDIRAGRVVSAEPFPAARNPSLKITVDFGPAVGELTTSARVAHYEPAELIGRLVVGAINLGTRRIATLDSEFLILGTFASDGRVLLLEVDPETPVGSPVA